MQVRLYKNTHAWPLIFSIKNFYFHEIKEFRKWDMSKYRGYLLTIYEFFLV